MKKTIKLSATGLRKIIEGIVREEAQLATPVLHPAWDVDEDLGTTAEDGPEDAHTEFSSLTAPVKATGMSGPAPYATEFDSACANSHDDEPGLSAAPPWAGKLPPKGLPTPPVSSDFDALTMTISTVEPPVAGVEGDDEELLLDEEPVDEEKGEWPSNAALKGMFKGDKTFAAKEKSAKEHGLKNPGGFVAAALKRLDKK